jgi:hypothetical protein
MKHRHPHGRIRDLFARLRGSVSSVSRSRPMIGMLWSARRAPQNSGCLEFTARQSAAVTLPVIRQPLR